jgi:hypothetical protein
MRAKVSRHVLKSSFGQIAQPVEFIRALPSNKRIEMILRFSIPYGITRNNRVLVLERGQWIPL